MGDLAGQRLGGGELVAEELYLQRGLRAEVDGARHDTARDEPVRRRRDLPGELFADRVDDLAVAPRPPVGRREISLDRTAVGPAIAREDGALALRDTDVGDDRDQLVGPQRGADDRLHAAHRALRLLDPGADRRLQIDTELRLVGRWEELGADEGPHPEPWRRPQAEACHEREWDRD